MAHHEDSNDHGHDMTEGSRQYYPKGWYLPLLGLFVVAFLFSWGSGALLGISGTDKWGKSEQCCADPHCDGNCEGHDDAHHDGEHHEGAHKDMPGVEKDNPSGQSNIVPADTNEVKAMADSMMNADSGKKHDAHDGHGH